MVSPQTTGSSGPGEVRIGAIGEAWNVVQKNLGTWIVAVIIYGVIALIFNFIMSRVGMQIGPTGIPSYTPIGYLLFLVSVALGSFIMGGFYRIALKQLRGEVTSPGDIFSAADVLPALLIAGIISTIAIAIGTALCIVPGLILAGLLMLATPIIVDQKVSAIDGLSSSLNTLKPHIGSSLIFLLALVVLNIIGAIPCGLGLLVTAPMSIVAVAIVYRDFFHGGTNIGDGNLFPPIPNIPPASQ